MKRLKPQTPAAARFADFIVRALDFWSEDGFDRRRGLFAERLDFAGRQVADAPYRAMVQARQIYVFADAARTAPRFADLALSTLDRTLTTYASPDFAAGCAFSLAPDGSVASAKQDAYTLAFLLFALAAAYRLAPEPRYLKAADALDAYLWSRLGDAGGVCTDDASLGAGKSQNPHMHLFEAYLALYEASGAELYLARARALARLFTTRMFQSGVLPETFARDWSPLPASTFEPGHHFEWIWLLARHDALSGEDHRAYRNQLWRSALQHGLDGEGRCCDEVSLPALAPRRSIRLWPHCEGVKAALVMTDAPEAQATLTAMLEALDLFLDKPFACGWIDRFDEQGRPSVDFVPASSLYHLYLAYSELAQA
jgi:mannose/cellobiose epimerase-like protein (N-acyl-D-glucosamine 2-epimerase family)